MTTIRITPTALTDSLTLRRTSCLANCTQVGQDGAGHYITVTTPRPSTGEQLVIDVLAWLNGLEAAPSDAELTQWLDDDNLAACKTALAAGQVVR